MQQEITIDEFVSALKSAYLAFWSEKSGSKWHPIDIAANMSLITAAIYAYEECKMFPSKSVPLNNWLDDVQGRPE